MNSALKYELEQLETLLSEKLPKAREGAGSKIGDYEEIKRHLADEVERIKKRFVHEVFAFGDERHLERYIQLHQQELIRIADELSTRTKASYMPAETPEEPQVLALLQYAYHLGEDLLLFIERHFTKYFDQDTKAPESYIALAGGDVVKSLHPLREQLQKLNADEALVELVLAPVNNLIESIPGSRITYRKFIYVKEIQKELRRTISTGRMGDDLNEDLRLLLLYLNYNSIKYFRYYTNHIGGLLNDTDPSPDRIERLSYILKMINQSQVKPGVGYNRTMRTLKEQISDWLSEEIAYLERIHQLNAKNSRIDTAMSETFKLRTEMPVAQLAYLLRIFVETKIVHNQNVSELIRFFSRFFLTKRLENISYESFRVRYYNVEDSTKRNVRNILLSMVDYINKT